MALTPIRILYVVNNGSYFLSHRLALARAAAAAGYEVHVATPPGPAVQGIAAEFSHHPFPLSRGGMRPWQEVRSLTHLVRLYRRLQPDLVHHLTIKPIVYGGIAARFTRTRAVVYAVPGLGYVFVAKGVNGKLLRSLVKPALWLAFRHPHHRVIFQNPDDRDTLVRAGFVSASRARLILGSGVDVAHVVLAPEPVGEPLVLFASRMLREKGVLEFVHAARLLRAAGAQARFALVGDTDPGNPHAVPADELRSFHAEGVVEWWGWRPDMADLLAKAAVVCLPSYYGEGVPRILIEAAAAERPIVTTDWPGCREIVRDGVNGFLVPVRDAAATAAAIRRLLDDEGLRRRFGEAGRRRAAEHFSLEVVIRQTLAVYDELVSAPNAGPSS